MVVLLSLYWNNSRLLFNGMGMVTGWGFEILMDANLAKDIVKTALRIREWHRQVIEAASLEEAEIARTSKNMEIGILLYLAGQVEGGLVEELLGEESLL